MYNCITLTEYWVPDPMPSHEKQWHGREGGEQQVIKLVFTLRPPLPFVQYNFISWTGVSMIKFSNLIQSSERQSVRQMARDYVVVATLSKTNQKYYWPSLKNNNIIIITIIIITIIIITIIIIIINNKIIIFIQGTISHKVVFRTVLWKIL